MFMEGNSSEVSQIMRYLSPPRNDRYVGCEAHLLDQLAHSMAEGLHALLLHWERELVQVVDVMVDTVQRDVPLF
jgi:galactokinase